MNHRLRLFRPLRLLLPALAVVATLGVSTARAQEALPAVLPEVLFLVEDSARMANNWDGDATLTSPDSRWSYVKDAIAQVIQNAPVGMTFGVALTADGTNDSTQANESLYGFEPLAYPGTSTADIITNMDAHLSSSNGERTFAESYTEVLDNWAEQAYTSPRSWAGGPFQYSCSELIIIVIGTDIGNGDDSPGTGYMTSDPLASGIMCDDVSGNEGCYGDNVAHFAYNTFAPPLAGTGSTKTYSLLVDAASSSIDSDAGNYFQKIATQGEGLYYSADVPGGIQTAIWQILTDTFSGTYSNAAVSATPAGDMLFASFFDVESGHPLYKGHLIGWDIDNDPTSSTFGLIIDGGGTYGEAWDAGQLLASRIAEEDAANSDGGLGATDERTGYTAYDAEDFYSTMQPFDASSIGPGTDLTTLLVDEIPATANEECTPLTHDFDFDCDSDDADAQLLVDFVRGVSTATFLHTGLPRGPWKMGDTGHSVAVPAPNVIEAAATEGHFMLFTERMADLPSYTYVSSNSGMVHAFTLEDLGYQGAEAWFYVSRAKANKSPSDSDTEEFDGFQLDDLMRSGQTYVNEGKLVLEYAWLDGYMTGAPKATSADPACPSSASDACDGPGYFPAQDDGAIDPCGCEWHRILVWSGGYGARHNYAIDVTIPDDPKFLWERNDTNGNTGPGKGRAVSAPAVGPFWDPTSSDSIKRRWLVFWGSGEQSPGVTTSSSNSQRAHASVFIHDMDTTSSRSPTDYDTQGYRVPKTGSHPSTYVTDTDSDGYLEYGVDASSNLIKGMFGTPTLVDFDGDASVDAAYLGDSLGYMFKVSFNQTAPSVPDRCLFASPDLVNDQARHLWYRPAVFFSLAGEVLVYYGSGSPHNIYSTEKGGLYVRADPSPFGCAESDPAPCATTSSNFDSSTGFMQFDDVGEKLVGDPIAAFGRLYFTTHAPGSDPCVLGSSYVYGLNVETCGGGIPDVTTDSYNQDSEGMKTTVDGLISAPVFANGRIYALNIDADGLDSDSMIEDLQVVPANFTSGQFMFSSFRNVF